MKLAELRVTEFADLLASDAPAPGGGFAVEVSHGHPVRFSPVPIFSESR